ncbi:hypothetical protein XH80_05595 [Bradyrhizobium sp. CCBAU 45384]|nr:hypothetical protein [Bradyrhizobium sp. CCBAU 45384]
MPALMGTDDLPLEADEAGLTLERQSPVRTCRRGCAGTAISSAPSSVSNALLLVPLRLLRTHTTKAA